jgi:hypothetical protein
MTAERHEEKEMRVPLRSTFWTSGITVVLLSALFVTMLAIHATTSAQTPVPGTPAAPPTAVLAQPEYHPSLGDLMTMAVQPRHVKLGVAGKEKNWAYAKYELSELRNAFARVARTIPVYRNADLGTLMTALTTEPLKNVEDAIAASDAEKFKVAYAKLTSTCNACHLSQDHPMVVIRVPDAMAFPDQDFRAQR